MEHAHVMEAIEHLCARDGVPTNATAVSALTGIAVVEVNRIVTELASMELLCASASQCGGSLCRGDSPMAAAACGRRSLAPERVRLTRLVARADQAVAHSRDLVAQVRPDRLARLGVAVGR